MRKDGSVVIVDYVIKLTVRGGFLCNAQMGCSILSYALWNCTPICVSRVKECYDIFMCAGRVCLWDAGSR